MFTLSRFVRLNKARFLVLKLLLMMGFFALMSLIPSSSGARDFFKITPSLLTPIDLYAITSVYDRSPKRYEAWAVGEQLDTDGSSFVPTQGVILYYNGTAWSKVENLPATPRLRGVAAARFLRTFTSTGDTNPAPTWASVVWAVGDGGTMLKLDPFTGSWKPQKQYKAGQPNAGTYCADSDVNDPIKCENWTANNLKAVSVVNDTFAVVVGEAGTVLTRSGGFATIGSTRQFTDSWSTPAGYTPSASDDLRAVYFLDSFRGWIAGVRANHGVLIRYRAKENNYSVAYESVVGVHFSSVVGMVRRSTTAPGNPLQSIVWVGTDADPSGQYKIYRFSAENATGQYAAPDTITSVSDQPIRSLALSRHAGGQNQNLVFNGTFDADRRDGERVKRNPDGWKTVAYINGFGTTVGSSHLIDPAGGVANRAFVGEAWQNIDKLDSKLTARSLDYATPDNNYDPFSKTNSIQGEGWFPYLYSSDFFGSDSQTFSYSPNKGIDITGGIVNNLSKHIHATIRYQFPVKSPYEIGARVIGYLKIDNPSPNPVTYDIKVKHPFGRASLLIENDTTDSPEQSRYLSSETDKDLSKAAKSWTVGSCHGKPELKCFTDADCQFGICALDRDSGGTGSRLCRRGATSSFSLNGFACAGSEEPCNEWTAENQKCDFPVSPDNGQTTARVTFPANGGLKARVCVDATGNTYNSCVDISECGAGQSCQLKGSGWYPFVIDYYQPNLARCAGTHIPCLNDYQCRREVVDQINFGTPKCTTGKWCVSGDIDKIGKPCTASGECGAGGSCLDQYTRTQCPAGYDTDSSPSCFTAANLGGNPDASLGLQWDLGDGNGFVKVPDDHLLRQGKVVHRGQSFALQEIPLSQVPGQSFKVEGRYKVDFFNQEISSYTPADPRKPTHINAGIATRCTAGEEKMSNNCGYDLNIAERSSTTGVTGTGPTPGTCKIGGNPCSKSSDCPGTDNVCQGQWVDFSAILSKQNRDNNGTRLFSDDPGQNLEIYCFADIGARIACDDIRVTPINNSAQPSFDQVEIWAVGDGGKIFRNNFDFSSQTLPASETWLLQKPPPKPRPVSPDPNLMSIASPDAYNFWAVGKSTTDENTSLLQLSPGNIIGWAWVFAASGHCRNDPSKSCSALSAETKCGSGIACDSSADSMGWIDFNCTNLGTCSSQPSGFGVTLNNSNVYGNCSNNVYQSCKLDGSDGGCGVGNFCTGGILSGSAWMGTKDPEETIDFGQCQNAPAGCDTSTGFCRADASRSCSSDGQCNGCDTNTGTCKIDASRLCSNNGQCLGTCSKNQGFRCSQDSECTVKCSQNPAACRSTGWLSFDRKRTGNPPDPAFTGYGFNAQYNNATSLIEGWARLQLGKCSNAKNLGCFKDSDCPSGGTCDYSDAPSCQGKTPEDCNAEAGWIKLNSGPDPEIGYTCNDCFSCQASTAPDKYNICFDRLPSPQFKFANKCTGCQLKKCSYDAATEFQGQPCTSDDGPVGTGCGGTKGACSVQGRCNGNLSTLCFKSSDCSAGDHCGWYGATCTSPCEAGYKYFTSIDTKTTNNFFGLGWSPDLGWIDFFRVRLGSSLFFQTKFGDIYSGGSVGSGLTGRSLGYPGGNPSCNATYRIVAAGAIENFCSSAPIPAGRSDNPFFIQPNASLFPLPVAENRYSASIGSFDFEGLTTIAKTVGAGASMKKYNKFGDVVQEYTPFPSQTSVPISRIFATTGAGTLCPFGSNPCSAKLGGKVYHVKGDLDVNVNVKFIPGGSGESGAGAIIVDGGITFNSDQTLGGYDTSSSITDRHQLPSVGFAAKGDITFRALVANAVGAFFTPKTITVESKTNDVQFVARGLMVANSFDFKRVHTGPTGTLAAEVVYYDGRIQTNQPPGFSNLSQGLPSFTER